MKILHIDIETSPHTVYAWGLFNQNISLNQIIEPTRVLCAAWAWHDVDDMHFAAEWRHGGRKSMIAKLYAALNEADAVCHYNGASFDVPHLNREFLEAGYGPPAPYAQIDLYRTVRRSFKFASNKLAWVSEVLALGDDGKLKTDMTLWTRVLDGDAAARSEMQRYNEEDVRLLKELYEQILPWIAGHPNVGLYDDSLAQPVCGSCGSTHVVKEGFSYTAAGKYQRYSCKGCGKWLRAAKRMDTTELRETR